MNIKKFMNFSFLFLFEKYKKNFFIFIEINFKKIFKKKKEKFVKILINWIQKKLLYSHSINSLVSLPNYFLNLKKTIFNFDKKESFLKKVTEFTKIISYFFIKTFLFGKKKISNLKIAKNSFCKKKLFFWEIFSKLKNLYPEKIWVSKVYGEKMVENFQSLESDETDTLQNIFFLKNLNFRKILKFFLKYTNHHSITIPSEHYSYNIIFNLFQSFLFFFIKIFRKPRKLNKRIQLKMKIFQENLYNCFYFVENKNFWIRPFKKIKIKNGPKIEIFPSYKHGWGVFSSTKASNMTIFSEYRGNYINLSDLNKIEVIYRLSKQDLFFFKLNRNFTVDATFSGNLGRLINHSCRPNCCSKIVFHSLKSYIIIFCLKNLNFFEELVYDYRINSDDFDHEQIICRCQNLICRKNLSI